MADVYKQSFKQNYTNNIELSIFNCGIERCAPGQTWGPGIRDHYLIHLVLSGKGVFEVSGRTWEVSAGTGLIGIGTFTLLSKLNPFVQDAGIAFDLWLFFSEMLSVVLTCTFSFLLNKRYTFSFRSVKGGLLLYLLYYALTTPLLKLKV